MSQSKQAKIKEKAEKALSAAELNNMLCCSCVWQIERVQNVTLWQSYQLMKKQLEVNNKHTNNEKLLFHGTDAASIKQINHRGFNRSYAGTHGNQTWTCLLTLWV